MSMQKQSDHTRYQLRRSLGVDKITKESSGLYRLTLGYSESQRQELLVDRASLDLIRACKKPSTASHLSRSLDAPVYKVKKICKALVRARVLHEESLPPEKLRRYDRHLLFFQNAGAQSIEVQKKISRSRIALIGVGGIGNWVALNLIGSGLKELHLIDFDLVEESNLTRQVLFSEKDIGKRKTTAARLVLADKNSQTKVIEHKTKVSSARELKKYLRGMDMVVLSADRPEKIHDWVDEVCVELKIPYINLGYRDGIGVVGPMTVPGKTSCYRCYKPRPTQSSSAFKDTETQSLFNEFDSRYQAPSFGPLNAWVSTLGALEILKYLGGFGTLASFDTELSLDPLELVQTTIKYRRDPRCWQCNPL